MLNPFFLQGSNSEQNLVQDLINELTIKVGEKIDVRRFVKFNLGEGIEKKVDDFAAEVAAMTGGQQ